MNDNFTEAARAEGQARIAAMLEAAGASDDIRAWFPAGFEKGAEWARTHLAAQEPTDAEVEAAQAEVVLHAPDFTKPGVIRCHCGAPGFWSTPDAHEQHALWHVLRAARRDEENR